MLSKNNNHQTNQSDDRNITKENQITQKGVDSITYAFYRKQMLSTRVTNLLVIWSKKSLKQRSGQSIRFITLHFIIPCTALLSSIQRTASWNLRTSQPTHFREIFRKSFYHVNTSEGSVVKQSGNAGINFIHNQPPPPRTSENLHQKFTPPWGFCILAFVRGAGNCWDSSRGAGICL